MAWAGRVALKRAAYGIVRSILVGTSLPSSRYPTGRGVTTEVKMKISGKRVAVLATNGILEQLELEVPLKKLKDAA